MNTLDKQYQELLKTILTHGVVKEDRTGTGTKSIFGYTIRHNMSEGFPVLTTKKIAWKSVVVELLWFMMGRTDLKYLVDNNCHIWNGDCYQAYLQHTILGVNNGLDKIKGYLDNCLVEFNGEYEHFNNPSFQYGYRPYAQEEFINKIKTDDEFAKKWGNLGPIYGKQWRDWGGDNFISGNFRNGIDQIQNLINDLKTNPDSRRLMVSSWNAPEISEMVLPPCHYAFQVYTRELSLKERLNLVSTIIGEEKIRTHEDNLERVEKLNIPTRAISLMYNARSQDVPLGTPFNLASYGLLLTIIAREVNMIPDELISNMGDCHIYLNQIEGVKEQLTREPYPLPTLSISEDVNFTGTIDDLLETCDPGSFRLEDYQSHPPIKIPLSN